MSSLSSVFWACQRRYANCALLECWQSRIGDTLDPQTLEQAQASEIAFFRDQVIANLLPERQAMQQLIESNITVTQLIR